MIVNLVENTPYLSKERIQQARDIKLFNRNSVVFWHTGHIYPKPIAPAYISTLCDSQMFKHYGVSIATELFILAKHTGLWLAKKNKPSFTGLYELTKLNKKEPTAIFHQGKLQGILSGYDQKVNDLMYSRAINYLRLYPLTDPKSLCEMSFNRKELCLYDRCIDTN